MKLLIVRLGAWGDMLIISPLIRFLHEQGHEIYLHTSEMGMNIMQHNPRIKKLLPYVSNSVPDHKLKAHWQKLAEENGCEKIINLCESIERALSFHPIDPMYSWPKEDRRLRGNKNFYEYTFEHAGYGKPHHDLVAYDHDFFIPEMHFTTKEEQEMASYFKQFRKPGEEKFVILWGLSGSGLNKSWPYVDFVIADVLRAHQDVVFITLGDDLCQALETGEDARVIRKSGRWTVRQSSLACKYADLVVAPDTGLLHASGCFDTPKIGLIGSNTRENITKHFKNDFSVEANSDMVPCAPCFRLIYQASMQCPIEEQSYLPKCMALGIDPKIVLERIENAIERAAKGKNIAV